MKKLVKGLELTHIPTGRPVRVVKVDEDAFEVVTLDDELGCRWRLLSDRADEFEPLRREEGCE